MTTDKPYDPVADVKESMREINNVWCTGGSGNIKGWWVSFTSNKVEAS